MVLSDELEGNFLFSPRETVVLLGLLRQCQSLDTKRITLQTGIYATFCFM